MDSSKLPFRFPYRTHNTDDRGALAHQVVDDEGKVVVACGLWDFGKRTAEMIADALNGAQASPLYMRAVLLELVQALGEQIEPAKVLRTDKLNRALEYADKILRGPAPRGSEGMRRLVDTVEVTGGLMAYPNGTHAPVADPDWIDLGDAYLAACRELARQPVIVEMTS